MALIPNDTYPGQTIAGDAGYPQGKARNITVPGDGTGTPLEKEWVNDLWGFLQSLLDEAGITPSGDADEVGASQYLEALHTLIEQTTNFNDAVTFGSSIIVEGNATFQGFGVFENAVGFALTSQFSGVATFLAQSSFADVATFSAGAIITDLVLHGDLISDSTWYQGREIQLSSQGRIRERLVYGADSVATYGVLDADVVVAKDMGSAHDWTVEEAGATIGSEITFLNFSSQIMTLKREAGSTICTLPAVGSVIDPSRVILRYLDPGDAGGLRWHVELRYDAP